jgi:hypothetical protein
MEYHLDDLSMDKVYRGEVTRISNSGNAIISLPGGFINLGAGSRSEVGDTVIFKKRSGKFGDRVSDTDKKTVPHVNKEYTPTKTQSQPSQSTTRLSLKSVGDEFSGSENDLLSNYNNDA